MLRRINELRRKRLQLFIMSSRQRVPLLSMAPFIVVAAAGLPFNRLHPDFNFPLNNKAFLAFNALWGAVIIYLLAKVLFGFGKGSRALDDDRPGALGRAGKVIGGNLGLVVGAVIFPAIVNAFVIFFT